MLDTPAIAVISNDHVLIDRICDTLKDARYQVSVVDATLRSLAENQPINSQLLLLDARPQGGVDVPLVCEAFRESQIGAVAIIAVIEGYDETIDALMQASVDDVLVSPFTSFSLLARVRSQLSQVLTREQLAFKIRDSWTLIEITSKLIGENDLLDNLYEMVTILATELQAHRVSVVLVPPEKDMGLVVASSDNQDVRDLIINLDAYPEIRSVSYTGDPLVIADVETSNVVTGILPTLQSVSVKSIALFPIVEQDDVLGVIFLRYKVKRESFSERERVFCQTVANATSIALRSHEFIESLREKDQKLEEVKSQAQNQLAALRPYEEFFLAAVDGLLVLSDTGVVVFVNPEGAAILGRMEHEIRGLPLYDMLDVSERAKLDTLIEQTQRGNRVSDDLIVSYMEQNDEYRKIISTSAALLGESGMILLSMRDVTEERRTAKQLQKAQAQLIQSEKQNAIMEVAGTAAHELNQPLTSILASMSLFKKLMGTQESPMVQRLFAAMEGEVDRMTVIIRKLSKLTDYSTKDYVGTSKILDLEQSTRRRSSGPGTNTP